MKSDSESNSFSLLRSSSSSAACISCSVERLGLDGLTYFILARDWIWKAFGEEQKVTGGLRGDGTFDWSEKLELLEQLLFPLS